MAIRWDKFTVKAQEAVQRAGSLASEHGNPEVVPLHLVAALIEDKDGIVPDLLACGCVLVVSHGNTLRALVKHLESMPDDRIAELDIPTGIPLVYQLGPDLRPDALGGQYLDPHAAREAIETIKGGSYEPAR